MFVCRYGVDFTCTYFDGRYVNVYMMSSCTSVHVQITLPLALYLRLRPLLGYDKDDLIGKQPFDLFHHEDIAAIVKCRNKGESDG